MSDYFKTPKGTELPMLRLKGKLYLQVAHRLVWFREEHPTWSIDCDVIQLTDDFCLMKAYIKTEDNYIVSTAFKQESKKDFPDFIEKANTGAIGRALALCGYGTQFAPELEENDRIVDAPLQPPKAKLELDLGQLLSRLSVIGVSQSMILKKFNVESVSQLNKDQIEALKEAGRQIHSRKKTVKDIFLDSI